MTVIRRDRDPPRWGHRIRNRPAPWRGGEAVEAAAVGRRRGHEAPVRVGAGPVVPVQRLRRLI